MTPKFPAPEVTSYLWIISFNASLLLNLSKIVRLYHFVGLPRFFKVETTLAEDVTI
jgi:hypothetical protein